MPDISRRRALTAGAALVTAGAAAALVAPAASAAGHDHGGDPSTQDTFDEVYKGRRIQGGPSSGGGHHHEHGGGYAVFVDGVQLHLMRNADGSWISIISHYAPVPTPRAAARAAVDELQGAPLLPFPAN
ncbi:tyrosinase cofactor [Streptomyces sp. NPDC040750]|uniref:apotyrosinase chaperone MelC1 n=1 Tax=Streptomyces sp. NPDC040750 TaxID=3154491 RepID=UPI0033EE8C92